MKHIFTLFFILLFGVATFAQDLQYSQYYANALYLSPAFAGSNQNSRAILHTRLQWPSLDATFVGTTFSFDHYFDKYKSGVGLLVNSDHFNANDANRFRNIDVGLQYAYQVDISDNWVFRPGLQLSFAQKTFNESNLTWGKQFNNQTGYDPGEDSGEGNTLATNRLMYPDLSAGALLFSKNLWFGISAHHLNTPTQSFLIINPNSPEAKLPIKGSFHAGAKILLGDRNIRRYGWDVGEMETSISPVMNYKMQGKFDQLDIGAYFRHNYMVFGAWYRGIPVKAFAPEKINNEAIIGLIGVVINGFNIGYSYDFTISSLSKARTGGAHELSLTYNFALETYPNKKQRPKNRKPVCPKF